MGLASKGGPAREVARFTFLKSFMYGTGSARYDIGAGAGNGARASPTIPARCCRWCRWCRRLAGGYCALVRMAATSTVSVSSPPPCRAPRTGAASR